MNIFKYVAYLDTLGTISADSLHPYLSAINMFYYDHKVEPVAQRPLVVDAVAGLKGMQKPVAPSLKRTQLPAAAAKAIHDDAAALSGDAGAKLSVFRDALASVVSFMWFNRSDTTHSLREGELQVDPDGNFDRKISLFPRQMKGKNGSRRRR